MGQALYRKYRSRNLGEIVGQEHVTKTLEQALKQGRISHAYLFTGPRGVGKTSIARILAHEINGIPYEDDSQHIDIIEIDAASNRRIDEIRELRDKVYVAPTSAKYKVYIIDEVHMLTREAFNALLKTLEEPPEHVVFILATTDAHKLPETIISRTQRFTFKPAEATKAAKLLSDIAKSEKIDISPEALDLVAQHSGGSFRDSVSLLDQVSSQGSKVEASDIQRLLGVPPDDAIEALLLKLPSATAAEVMQDLDSLYGQGYQAAAIAKQLARLLRAQLADNSLSLDKNSALELLANLIGVPAAHDPGRYLEIKLLNHVSYEAVSRPKAQEIKKSAKAPVLAPVAVSEEQESPKAESEAPNTQSKRHVAKAGSATLDISLWPELLSALKAKHNTLYGVVRMAQPEFTQDSLKLSFAFAFHEKRIKESANRQKIADIVYELTGTEVSIECVLDKQAKAPKVEASAVKQAGNEDISAISNIFGSAELLES